MLPGDVLPAVPAVEPAAPLGDALPGDEVAPGELLLVLPDALPPEVELDPMRAFVSMKVPLPVGRDVLDVAPAVPLVPVAPGVLPLP